MGADTTNEAAMPAGPEEPRRERQRKRRRWLVTIGGLPSRRAYKYVPAFRKIALVQEPCALPPADPDVFPRKRDAMRAMRRTIAFNRFIMGKLALCGDWLIRKTPGIERFTKPMFVEIRSVTQVETGRGWLREGNFHA